MFRHRISSVRLIPLSFLAAILLGAVLLTLPISSADGQFTAFTDALFTSATSVCVTGLTVVTTASHWSIFGKVVIVCLIQIGGLGIITIYSLIMLLAHRRFTLSDRIVLQDSLNLRNTSGVLKFLIRVIKATLIFELFGALIYAIDFIPRFGITRGITVSVFNSVSAFCNAGMDIIGDSSLTGFYDNPLILITTMFLIFAGGIGYVVWFDIASTVKNGATKRISPRQIIRRLPEHSKLSLIITLTLILSGGLIIFITEYSNPDTIGSMTLSQKILNSLFESITFRTAGFNTFPQAPMRDISCVAAYTLMFIGGSPVGTAGGVKTITFFLSVMNVVSYIRGENDTTIFNRRITAEQMRKSTVIISVSAVAVLIMTILLNIINDVGLKDGLFEVISASATVGLTRDVTPILNTGGKLLITFAMYIGRIAPLSMVVFFAGQHREDNRLKYPEAKIYIG